MPPMKSALLFAGALLLTPGLGRADLVIDRNNLQQLKDAIREMNEAPPPLPPKKAPKRKAAATSKPSAANKPSSVPAPESVRPDPRPALPAPAAGPPPLNPAVSPTAEPPAPTAAEIRAEHERVMRDSPSLEEELRRKHQAIVGNSPSMKETLERQHQKILAEPPPASPSPTAADRQ